MSTSTDASAETSPASLTGLHHVALRAHDFAATLAFYEAGLGLKKQVAWTMKDGTSAALLAIGGGSYLEVFSNGSPDDAAEGTLPHLCFRTADVAAAHARALAAGARERLKPTQVDIEDTVSGKPVPVTLSFVYGPSGEVVEFMQTDGSW